MTFILGLSGGIGSGKSTVTRILAELGASKRAGQVLVGFAAETDSVRENALAKLEAKGADLLVANDVSADGVGFSHDTNAVSILAANGSETIVELTSKADVARAVMAAVVAQLSSVDNG
jgi:phosphopantothenoylcysteine decarboxylase/phosphopantothenate--cysteine ligase